MNQVDTSSKNRLLKTLAVFGFVAIVIFGTWLAVKIVQLVPTGFASLASLAESVQDGRKAQNDIDLTVADSVINANESFTIAWSDLKRPGTYYLWYDCIEGVAMDIRVGTNTVAVPCDTDYPLPTGILSIDARFTSDSDRFTDIPYEIFFVKEGEADVFVSTSKVVTIVNANIPTGIVLGDEDADDNASDSGDTISDTENTDDTVPDNTPTPSTPTVPTTKYVYTTTYTTPVSNPQGYTDLKVAYKGVGVLTSAGRFLPQAELDSNDTAAFQFEVKNIGTKTSGEWTFKATLTSGDTFTSKVQAPLKPNESSILTLAFDNPGEDGFQTFGATVYGGNDTNTANNSFSWGIDID